jgi:hypothetical protein
MTKKSKKPKSPTKAQRHAAVDIVTIFGVTERFGPIGLILYAEFFLAGARDTRAPVQAPNFPVVRAYLACHSLELAFKAFLALKGKLLLELAGGPYGHDLKFLIEEADRNDLRELVTLDDQQRSQIVVASEYYGEKVFEYPAVSEALFGYPKMPDTDVLIAAAEALIEPLKEPCRSAR